MVEIIRYNTFILKNKIKQCSGTYRLQWRHFQVRAPVVCLIEILLNVCVLRSKIQFLFSYTKELEMPEGKEVLGDFKFQFLFKEIEVSTMISSISKLTELKIQGYLPYIFYLLLSATCHPACIMLCVIFLPLLPCVSISHQLSRAFHFKCRISLNIFYPFKSNTLLAQSKSS